MTKVLRALVVDDEDNIAFLVASALRLQGMVTATASGGFEALRQLQSFGPDVVVLDVMLPDLDGFEVLRRMRNDGHRQPVLFLSARDATEDRVRGLTIGGDDYVPKPFSIEELLARVGAVLRRAGLGEQRAALACGDVVMDDEARVVTKAGREVHLSRTEYELLRYLLTNAGRVLTRAQILDHVWDYDFEGDPAIVETFISYLRRKVDTTEPRLIHTVRGVGYSIRVPG
jgi:two-component system OmpR family response regulator